MEGITDKELLLRIIKHTGTKRKVTRIKDPKLTVDGLESTLVEANFDSISYANTPSLRVRKALRNIIE